MVYHFTVRCLREIAHNRLVPEIRHPGQVEPSDEQDRLFPVHIIEDGAWDTRELTLDEALIRPHIQRAVWST